jgi:hypothetical protein
VEHYLIQFWPSTRPAGSTGPLWRIEFDPTDRSPAG